MRLFSSKRQEKPLDIGGIFYHRRESGMTEVAEIMSVAELTDGITHVRFRVSYEQSGSRHSMGDKVLSLESFMGRYKPGA